MVTVLTVAFIVEIALLWLLKLFSERPERLTVITALLTIGACLCLAVIVVAVFVSQT